MVAPDYQASNPAPWPEDGIVPCPACGGDGGWEADEMGPALKCRHCDGTGEVATEPVEEEDCFRCGSLFDAECPKHGRGAP